MEKGDVSQYRESPSLYLKKEANDEVLEISSTGYGLEPVLREESRSGHSLLHMKEKHE
ncbi:hypothetical protein [Pseudobacillus badius]|uniref:hypothetical protein n=1 Tax=Bacillus badius TaxID=1455 RepID=UPI000B2F1AB5|nr:hypothetical protein [Bacillus badius]MED0667669.1 hypothetical protein [Bacillus badius]TDW02253.1 hypothetical protein B0G66_10784 [Bacillus badius]UAT31385.1 hypothetical protein K7T73_03880 [Bacillus badius]GLY11263.1 hypothetical protein Bbad01_24790 [Bacillus badius]